jgi:hypothetical protein
MVAPNRNPKSPFRVVSSEPGMWTLGVRWDLQGLAWKLGLESVSLSLCGAMRGPDHIFGGM